MIVFKQMLWKWWELKIIAAGGFFLGLALGSHFGVYLENWLWLIWVLFVVLWAYVIIAWLKKISFKLK